MNTVFRSQFRQRPVSRQSRHRHLCLEFRTVLLAFRSHLSLPFQPVSISLANCPKKRDRRSDLVGQPVRLYNPEEWVGLQQRIKAKYSTREESAMFEAVMAGVPVHEAVARFNQEMREQEDDIEFF